MIPFTGLKLGKHVFEFDVSDEFFEGFEYSIIQSGNVHVVLTLEKKETMMIGEYEFNGKVNTSCDRCNDPVEVKINGSYRLIYKFDTDPSNDETLMVLPPEAYELDVRDSILEFITVSLPSRCIHAEGECNEEMISLLKEYSSGQNWDSDEDNDDVDPRWEALKKLK